MAIDIVTGEQVSRGPTAVTEAHDVSNWWRIILLIIVIIIIIILWWIFTNPQAVKDTGIITTNNDCYMLLWKDFFTEGTPDQEPSGGRNRNPPFVQNNDKYVSSKKIPKDEKPPTDIIKRPLVENWSAQKLAPQTTGTGQINFYSDNIANSQIIKDQLHIRLLNTDAGPTSARLVTRLAFKEGFFAIRAKLPKGPGLWPSILMLPFKNVGMNIVGNQRLTDEFNPYLQEEVLFKEQNPWPSCGEIDIVETFGNDPIWYGTLFFGGSTVVSKMEHTRITKHIYGPRINSKVEQQIFQAPPFPCNGLIKLDLSLCHIFGV